MVRPIIYLATLGPQNLGLTSGLQLHRQPPHHASADQVPEGMLTMGIVQGIEHRKCQLGLPYVVTGLLPPEEVAKPEIEEVVAADIF
jgi:hypothetical protein